MRIKSLSASTTRYAITLESGETYKVSLELIAELKLRAGRDLSEAELAAVQRGAREIACYDKALATLGARARSTADLTRWLKTKEFTNAEIAPALEKLTALGLLDDRAYALTFARARLGPSRGYGPRRVAAELARKGVARAVVDAVLAELEAEREDQHAAERGTGGAGSGAGDSPAEAAARKKLKSLAKLEPEVARRRLYGFLARRGFGGAEIRKALELLKAP